MSFFIVVEELRLRRSSGPGVTEIISRREEQTSES